MEVSSLNAAWVETRLSMFSKGYELIPVIGEMRDFRMELCK